MSHLLPETPGLLPKWTAFVACMATFNALQNVFGTGLTRRVYSQKPAQVTELSARTFGIWTLLSAVVRFYCAYHITEKTIYDVTIWSYVIVLFHFGSELLAFRTAKLGAGLISPLIVGSTSLIWMITQRGHYLNL